MGFSRLAGWVPGDLQVGTTDADVDDNGARGVVAWAWLGRLVLARCDVLGWDNPAMTGMAVGLSKVSRNLLLDGGVL